jgi:hypothetical protein
MDACVTHVCVPINALQQNPNSVKEQRKNQKGETPKGETYPLTYSTTYRTHHFHFSL